MLRALKSQSAVSNTSLWSKNVLLLFLNTLKNEAILTIVDTQNPGKFNTRWFMRLSASCKSYSESLYRKKNMNVTTDAQLFIKYWVARKNVPNSMGGDLARCCTKCNGPLVYQLSYCCVYMQSAAADILVSTKDVHSWPFVVSLTRRRDHKSELSSWHLIHIQSAYLALVVMRNNSLRYSEQPDRHCCTK